MSQSQIIYNAIYQKLIDSEVKSCVRLDDEVKRLLPYRPNESPKSFWNRSDRICREVEKRANQDIASGILPAENLGLYLLRRKENTTAFNFWNSCTKMNPNTFADQIGRILLRTAGCQPENQHITPDRNDWGIDYWGITSCTSVLDHPRLIIGQVKQHRPEVKVSRPDLQQFYGSVISGLGTIFPHELRHNIVMQYVSASDYTEDARQYAKSNGILPLTIQILKTTLSI